MDIINFLKAMANPVRLRCLVLLQERTPGSLCVCDFMDLLDCSQSTISRHFKQLRDLQLVIGEQREQWVHYRINPDLPKNRNALLQSCIQQASIESPYCDDISRLKQLTLNCT